MANWKSANLGDVLPDSVESTLNSAKEGGEFLSGVLDVVQTGLNIAKEFLLGLSVFDALSIMADAIEAFKADLKNAGVYYLPVWDNGIEQLLMFGHEGEVKGTLQAASDFDDQSYKERVENYFLNRYGIGIDEAYAADDTPVGKLFAAGELVGGQTPTLGASFDTFVNKIIRSFDDPGDVETLKWYDPSDQQWHFEVSPKRPVFSNSAEVVGIVLMAGAPSGAELIQSLQQVVKLFNSMTELTNLLNGLRALTSEGMECLSLPDSWKILTGEMTCAEASIGGVNSTYPDWQNFHMSKIPFVRPILEMVDRVLDPSIALLKAGGNSKDAMVALIQAIQGKLAALQQIIDQITQVLGLLGTMLTATGFYVVYIRSREGTNGWKTLLRKADKSAVPFATNNIDTFVMGATLLAGGPGIRPFELFFKVFEDD